MDKWSSTVFDIVCSVRVYACASFSTQRDEDVQNLCCSNKRYEGDEIEPWSAMRSSVRGTGEKGINILSGEPEVMRSFGTPALNCENDIKIDVEHMACVKEWIETLGFRQSAVVIS